MGKEELIKELNKAYLNVDAIHGMLKHTGEGFIGYQQTNHFGGYNLTLPLTQAEYTDILFGQLGKAKGVIMKLEEQLNAALSKE